MENSASPDDKHNISFVGNYLPRRCGIATFTTDLCEAVAQEVGEKYRIFAVCMNDIPEGYDYPERVRFEVRQNTQSDYLMAADYLNIHRIEVVCVQHEFGIFGGPMGAHILSLLRELRMPSVATLHTVLREPSEEMRRIVEEMSRFCDRLVVLSRRCVDMLEEIYGVPREKVTFIPHGIPDLPFVDPSDYKARFHMEGRKVILSFGLLGPGKGLEQMIDALPAVAEVHPEVLYVVLGATHPAIKRTHGEEYRNSLRTRARELGLDNHIKFLNRFVELEELCEYLNAADIYVTPYPHKEQIVSGTLAYAMGAGKAIVSTPFWYAEEMLDEGRGRLVPFGDVSALSEELCDLLENDEERHAMSERAYQWSRHMVWKKVASQYFEVFKAVCAEREALPRPAIAPRKAFQPTEGLVEIDLRHMHTLTDDTGIVQHAIYATPDRRHGYCTDDNARALIVAAMHWDLRQDASILPLLQTYLSFLSHALDEKTGRYRNFMSYDRRWLEDMGSEDSQGRALWGLGMTVAFAPNDSILGLATNLFQHSAYPVRDFVHPRSISYALVGIHAYLRRFGGDAEIRRLREHLAERLLEFYKTCSAEDWPWCDDKVSSANAKVPHALILSGQWMRRGDMLDIGLHSLEWLLQVQKGPEGQLSVVGNKGWMTCEGERANFDQQPIEASELVDACIEAYHATQDKRWAAEARRCYEWYVGRNDLRIPLYDFKTGGCHDALEATGMNENEGAESTICWLIALCGMHLLRAEITLIGLETYEGGGVEVEPSEIVQHTS